MNGSVPAPCDLLICFSHPPYGSEHSRAGLDTALAASALGLQVKLLFVGSGVLNLQAQQEGSTLGLKTLSKALQALPLYDIEELYVDATALGRFQMSLDPQLHVVLLDEDSVAQMLRTEASCLTY